MYQLGLQVKKKNAKGGEFISPMLNISKGHTPHLYSVLHK